MRADTTSQPQLAEAQKALAKKMQATRARWMDNVMRWTCARCGQRVRVTGTATYATVADGVTRRCPACLGDLAPPSPNEEDSDAD